MSPAIPSVPLLAALRASCPEVSGLVELIETHISWVFLAGEYAFKIKKPANFGFLDFSTLEKRRFFCEEELRLNRRTAPELYLGMVPIMRGPHTPGAPGGDRVIEYALKMRRFPQEALADNVAQRGALGPAEVDAIAAAVAAFHAALPAAPADSDYGAPEHVAAPALQNFAQLDELVAADAGERVLLADLQDWTRRESAHLHEVLAARRHDGFVRECHGDLHLGNIAFLDGRPTLFDCIEFNPELRWIDVMNEVAFLVMDLIRHRLDWAAWRLLSAYLEATGDYAGMRVLRYYLVYRAMVRAKVARLRAAQCQVAAAGAGALREYDEYLDLARSLAASARPALVLMHGLSGAGKSTIAQAIVAHVGAVRVRSDVERKRLHGLAAATRTQAEPDGGIYSAAATRATYDRLEQVARDVVDSGYTVVVDAAFLRRAERDRFGALAAERGVPFLIVACSADEETLRARLVRREVARSDASEAGVAVLERQLMSQEPLGADERAQASPIDSGWDERRLRRAIDEIAASLAGRA